MNHVKFFLFKPYGTPFYRKQSKHPIMMIERYRKHPINLLIRFCAPKSQKIHPIHTRCLAIDLQSCSSVQQLMVVQGIMIKTNAIQDCYLMNQFISVCSSFNNMDRAVSVFAQMASPNAFVYNALIRGLVHRSSWPVRALEFYMELLRAKLCPTSYTFSSLVKACGMVSAFWFGQAVHSQVWRCGFQGHVFVQTALVEFYANLGGIVESRKVFDEMPERDLFAWTTMVLVYTRSGDMVSARSLFDGLSERSATTWNAMIDGFARLGDVESAALMFNQMPVKDLISWTMMITCYSRNKQYKEALSTFSDMINNGICPDMVTLATVISSCAHLGALDLGRQIHFYAMEHGHSLDVYVGSALIDMYAKCGSLDRALLVFYKLREKNIFCWNSVIDGLAVHGCAKEALIMFFEMLEENVYPNGVTFISVLSACVHAGLVTQGRKLFEAMTRDFSIAPQIEHYGCMVDLLCRARLLEDALEVIRRMKIEPNSVVWGALLSGCKRCKNLEIAEIAVSRLMVLEPNNCGYYNLLINIYFETNRWTEVLRMRTKMKELGIEKDCPGSSWIELESEIHQFAASDISHPASNEIYLVLDDLDGPMKLFDQASEFESVF